MCGEHGISVTLDWASKKQGSVARPSGEAETVALGDALRRITGVNRGLCASGIPALDALEQMLERKLDIHVLVDATVCKAAAEKGASKHMRHMSKMQGVDLFWTRDAVRNLGISIKKVGASDNVADVLTKPLCGPQTKALREKIGVRGEATECA